MARRKRRNLCKEWKTLCNTPLSKLKKLPSRTAEALLDHIDRCEQCERVTLAMCGGNELKALAFIHILIGFYKPSEEDRKTLDDLAKANEEDENKIAQAVSEFLKNHAELLPENFGLGALPLQQLFLGVHAVSILLSRSIRHSAKNSLAKYVLVYNGEILAREERDDGVFESSQFVSEEVTVKEICAVALKGGLDNEADMETARRLVSWVVAAARVEPDLLTGFSASTTPLGIQLLPVEMPLQNYDDLDPWRCAPAHS